MQGENERAMQQVLGQLRESAEGFRLVLQGMERINAGVQTDRAETAALKAEMTHIVTAMRELREELQIHVKHCREDRKDYVALNERQKMIRLDVDELKKQRWQGITALIVGLISVIGTLVMMLWEFVIKTVSQHSGR